MAKAAVRLVIGLVAVWARGSRNPWIALCGAAVLGFVVGQWAMFKE